MQTRNLTIGLIQPAYRVLPLLLSLLLSGLVATGCHEKATVAAIESDANGYLCLKCGAKFCTSRNQFLEAKCPKCQQYGLVEVVGYLCNKDQHITIRPRVSGAAGAAVCEVCGAQLSNAMVLPQEKDLLAWGATKTKP